MSVVIDIDKIVQAYLNATSRLIILDYDGTLVPFDPHLDMFQPPVRVKELVRALAADQRNKVVLTSGRGRESLEKYWRDVPIVLMAEHGAFRMEKNLWEPFFSSSPRWISRVLNVFTQLTVTHEGSFMEQKTFSISWYYRAIADRIKSKEKLQILADLSMLAERDDIVIYDSEDIIELRTRGINKGSALTKWLGDQSYNFIMAIGDGLTDEDIFKVLPDDAFSIKVGKASSSCARFRLDEQADVFPFLKQLAEFEEYIAKQ